MVRIELKTDVFLLWTVFILLVLWTWGGHHAAEDDYRRYTGPNEEFYEDSEIYRRVQFTWELFWGVFLFGIIVLPIYTVIRQFLSSGVKDRKSSIEKDALDAGKMR